MNKRQKNKKNNFNSSAKVVLDGLNYLTGTFNPDITTYSTLKKAQRIYYNKIINERFKSPFYKYPYKFRYNTYAKVDGR